MIKYEFSMTYDGVDFAKWDKMFRKRLAKSLKKAGRKLATVGPLSLKSHIKNAKKFSNRYPANSIFYKASKGNKSVLYNVGFLRNAPRYEVNRTMDSNTYASVDIGFLSDVQHPSGTSLHKIIGSIQKGGEWKPSPQQRKAYWAKMNHIKNEAGAKFERHDTYKQPARDFMKGYLEEVDINPVIEKSVIEALSGTLETTRTKVKIG